ncbi:MAG: hypothetical protein HOW71_01365 [Nonomuraea sp.]|nr:hypothetical protein [Nonomuraea sp.]NUS09078.1 hypothetical protein [Nonomuraea sp.]
MSGEPTEIIATQTLLINSAANLSIHGNWIDERLGREMFDRLREADAHIYAQAFRRALSHPLWRTVLTLAIKIGQDSALDTMAGTLYERGGKELAEMYLNTGCPYLVRCASDWAAARGYVLIQRSGRGFPQWGLF